MPSLDVIAFMSMHGAQVRNITVSIETKPGSWWDTKPLHVQHNGKVERSHRSDKDEFYQLLTYEDDVDLVAKLEQWENFYNYHQPDGAFRGKTSYEVLREKMIR